MRSNGTENIHKPAALDRSHLRGEPTWLSRIGTAQEDLKKIQQLHGKATADIFERVIEMPRNTYVVLYSLVLISVVVSVDLLFYKNRFWERLIVNIGIVLVFAAFYLRFLKNP